MAENVVIKEVLNNPFSVRPLHDKLRIVNKSWPTPPSPNVIAYHKNKTEQYTWHFTCISQYEKVDWVAGCETRNKLYCWPCLLFSNKLEVWNKQGFLDFNLLSSAQQKHSKSQTYVPCYLELKLSGKQQKVYLLPDAQCWNDIIKHNEQVKKKRVILCQFIDAVHSLANQNFRFGFMIFKHRKFRGICQCVEKSSEFSHCFLFSNTN
jgi:hypothetical protein